MIRKKMVMCLLMNMQTLQILICYFTVSVSAGSLLSQGAFQKQSLNVPPCVPLWDLTLHLSMDDYGRLFYLVSIILMMCRLFAHHEEFGLPNLESNQACRWAYWILPLNYQYLNKLQPGRLDRLRFVDPLD